MKIRPLVKWFGGKSYHTWFINEHLPTTPYHWYGEFFLGGGASFLNIKVPASISRIASDINTKLINLWKYIQADVDHFIERLEDFKPDATTFSEALYDRISEPWAFYIKHNLSRGGMGQSYCDSSRLRGGQHETVNAWYTRIAQLPMVSALLDRTTLLNVPFVELNEHFQNKEFFIYLDPPYPKETRYSGDVYEHEMTTADHEVLLDILTGAKAKCLLSGRPNDLYDRRLSSWNRFVKLAPNRSSCRKHLPRQEECLWCNY